MLPINTLVYSRSPTKVVFTTFTTEWYLHIRQYAKQGSCAQLAAILRRHFSKCDHLMPLFLPKISKYTLYLEGALLPLLSSLVALIWCFLAPSWFPEALYKASRSPIHAHIQTPPVGDINEECNLRIPEAKRTQ